MKIASLEQLTNTPSWFSRKTPVICTQVIDETPDVKTFQFQALDHQQFHFKPGQFIGMQIEINGELHNRSYTIASTPSRPHSLELTIKKEDGGKVSPWLHQNIVKGSQIEIRGPAGRFNCFDTSHDKVLLISAGSGITPMMSMARFFTDTDSNKDVQFINWVKSVDDIIFRRELALMEHKNPQFKLEVFLYSSRTQPELVG
ncbi:MAG: FAD-binding oxidoreductase [Enterobacterales bacterium]|nr:FAD-binding oxidoreductase [Enterobacterales bacterium]